MIDKGNLLGSLGNRRRPQAMTRLWPAVPGRTVQEQTGGQQAGLLRWFWVILAALLDACQWEANYARWNQMPGYVARERSGVWQEITTLGLWKERNSPCAAG